MTDDTHTDESDRLSIVSRRRFLQTGVAGGALALAGCQFAPVSSSESTETESGDSEGGDGDGSDGGGDESGSEDPEWYGSGPGAFEQRPAPGGTSMDEMPDLEGTLNVYSGRGEGLVGDLLEFMQEKYDGFTVKPTYDTAASLANRIVTEGGNTPADVFYSVNAGALGFLQNEGRTNPLSDETASLVGERFRANNGAWIGTSGRARTVPFNTDALSESGVPEDVMAFPDEMGDYAGKIGWAPTYSSFQGFVTAMLILEGEEATREWVSGMQDLDVQEYNDEFAVSQAVADGELAFGFANHYYIQRVLAGRPEAPISTAFTTNDAGSVFNVAGAARIKGTNNADLADNFVRHLLSSEAQEYFAIKTFEYPMVDGVDPVGRLPAISELDVPDVNLSKLSDLDRTVQLLRDEGVL
jgi:iron(III) transport system substrate-binding protein